MTVQLPGAQDGTVRVWRLDTAPDVPSRVLAAYDDEVAALCVFAGGRHALSAADKHMLIHDVATSAWHGPAAVTRLFGRQHSRASKPRAWCACAGFCMGMPWS